MSKNLKDFLFANESSGDWSGAGTFRGGPFGFGNRYQLADSEIWPGLVDPAEDLPNNPSMWPAVHAQEESDKEEGKSLESPGVYDDRVHILPNEDEDREEYLDPKNDVEPSYFYVGDYVNERGPSDILYRDLPGFPRMNTLVDKEEHVPEDEDPDRDPEENPEEERYNVPRLLPSGREGDRGKPFGHGRYEDAENLTMNRDSTDTNMFDPMNQPPGEGNELNLQKKRNRTLNRWKETEQKDQGHTNRDLVSNHLVKPVDWVQKEFGQQDYKKQLDEPDDVPMAVGYAGVVVNPVKHVPGPINNYTRDNSHNNRVRESKERKMTTPPKEKREKFVPKELDKSSPDKTYGTGMGQILKQFDMYPDDFGAKKLKQHEPLPKMGANIPYTYDPDKIVTIIQTKLFEKLAKLVDKK